MTFKDFSENYDGCIYIVSMDNESAFGIWHHYFMKFENDKQVLQFFFDEFNEEFNYESNKRYYPSLQQRIEQYLKGLPGCCSIEYADYNILQLGIKWGVLSSTDDKKACKFVANFFSVLALRIIQAATKVGININMYL